MKLLSLLILVVSHSVVQAQTFPSSTTPLVKFSYDCASTDIFESAKLNQVVPRILKHYPNPDSHVNRAFAFDLNGDKRPEYFVPFSCGAVGNCDWAVFSGNRFMGMVNGEYVYVYKTRSGWPRIFSYGHLSAAEGAIETYRFNRRYERQKPPYPVGDEDQKLEIQNVEGRKLPKVFHTAKSACEM